MFLAMIKFELCLEITFHAHQNWNYRFWIELYVAENQHFVRTNKHHVTILFASNNVCCHKCFPSIVCNNSDLLRQANNKFADLNFSGFFLLCSFHIFFLISTFQMLQSSKICYCFIAWKRISKQLEFNPETFWIFFEKKKKKNDVLDIFSFSQYTYSQAVLTSLV